MILEKTPADRAAMYRRWQTLQCLGRVLEQEGKLGESIGSWERAIKAGESILPLMPDPDIDSMAVRRMALARLVEQRGDRQRARTLLEANIEMVKRVPAQVRTSAIAARLRETSEELYFHDWDFERISNLDWARRVIRSFDLSSDWSGPGAIQVSEAAYLFQQSLSSDGG
jgi:hypothetical protein